MFASGKGVFVQIPDGSVQRVLHPATIVAVDSGVLALEFSDPDFLPQAGQAVLVFFDRKGEFTQQAGRIGGVRASEPRAVVGVELVGKPVSAESRQSYRISTAVSGLTATVGSIENCRLLDVSATGFAVLTDKPLTIGDIVKAVLSLDGDTFTGEVSVQNAGTFADGLTRYGLYCVSEGEPGYDLQSGLLRISVHVQREQLRRYARCA